MFRFLLILFAVLTASIAHSQSKSLEPIHVQLQWKHQFEFAGFYAAIEEGYYREIGLDVKLHEYDASFDIVSQVVSGTKEIGLMGSGLVHERLSGSPVVMLANYFKRSPLVIMTSPDILLPSELKGKRLMITEKDLKGANFLQMFRSFSVDPEKDIKIVPHSFDVNDFATGKVDAMSVFLTNEPYAIQKKQIPYNLLDPNNYGVSQYEVNLFTSESYASRYPERLREFIRATNKGWEYALENQLELVELILEKYNSQGKTAEELLYEARETEKIMLPKIYPIGSIDEEKIRKISELSVQLGQAPSLKKLPGFLWGERKNKKQKIELGLTTSEKKFLEEHPIITVANDKEWPPFDFYENGVAKGYSMDYMRVLAELIGIELKFIQDESWERLVDRFENKEIDVITAYEELPERYNYALFTSPYLNTQESIIIRNDGQFLRNYLDLYGKRVAIVKGYDYETVIQEGFSQIEMVMVDTPSEGLRRLSHGEVDAFLENSSVASYLIKVKGLTNLTFAGNPNFPGMAKDDPINLAVRNDWPELHSIISKAMKLVPDARIAELEARWLSSATTVSANPILEMNEVQRQYLNKKKAITFCAVPNWLPYSHVNRDGDYEGIAEELMRLISSRIGVPLNVELHPTWREAVNAVMNHQCDLLPLAAKNDQRRQHLNFTTPYISSPFVLVTKTDQPFFQNDKNLFVKPVGVIKGYVLRSVLEEKYPDIEIVDVNSIEDGLQKVRSGEIWGYVDVIVSTGYFIQKEAMYDIKVGGQLPITQDLSVASRNDEPILGEIMQLAVESISEDEKRAIINHWISFNVEKGFDYSLFWKLMVLVAIGLAAILYRYYTLSKFNRKVRASETKFRQLFESSSDAVMLLDARGFFDCNEITLKMFECSTVEEFCSHSPASLSPEFQPDGTYSNESAEKNVAKAFGGQSKPFYWLHKRLKSEKTFHAEVLLSPFFYEGEEALQAVVRDITLRIEQENALKEAKSQIELAHQEASDALSQVATLLNNSGQGFLSFSSDLKIDEGYSLECRNIFREEILGQSVEKLLCPKDERSQKIIKESILAALECHDDELRQSVFLSLIPSEYLLQGNFYRAEYRPINGDKLMLILTDITEEKALKDKIESERQRLEFIVNAMEFRNDFLQSVQDFRGFCDSELPELLVDSFDINQAIKEIYRKVHTFKGVFSQQSLPYLPKVLHDLESALNPLLEDSSQSSHSMLITLMKAYDLNGALNHDLEQLRDLLGGAYFTEDKEVCFPLSVVEDMEAAAIKQLESLNIEVSDCELLPLIRRLRFVSLESLIAPHFKACSILASRLGKPINPIELKGPMTLVDPRIFNAFCKSLVHVFRNSIDHGIEDEEERFNSGKDDEANIQCDLNLESEHVVLSITDDGRGINTAALEEKASEMGLEWSGDPLSLIFEDALSTRNEASDLSGRGIGMGAVKASVEEIGGYIEVESKLGLGTSFRFYLPRNQYVYLHSTTK